MPLGNHSGKKATSPFFSSRPPGYLRSAGNSSDRMTVAQKEWPEHGRILMARISKSNGEPGGKYPLAGGVALLTGGSRGICRAIARQVAMLGASRAIWGRDPPALEDSEQGLASIGMPVHCQIALVTNPQYSA